MKYIFTTLESQVTINERIKAIEYAEELEKLGIGYSVTNEKGKQVFVSRYLSVYGKPLKRGYISGTEKYRYNVKRKFGRDVNPISYVHYTVKWFNERNCYYENGNIVKKFKNGKTRIVKPFVRANRMYIDGEFKGEFANVRRFIHVYYDDKMKDVPYSIALYVLGNNKDMSGSSQFYTIDHIDGNTLNDSLDNLQELTRPENTIKGDK